MGKGQLQYNIQHQHLLGHDSPWGRVDYNPQKFMLQQIC